MNHSVRRSNTRREQQARAFVLACALLLVLPSCGIPALRGPDPAPPPPETYHGETSEENSAQLRIEEFFEDPTLTSLVNQAVAGNQELRILAEDVQIASNEVLSRRGAYLPFLSFAAGAGLNKASSYTLEGAGLRDDPFRPGQLIPNPHGTFLLAADLTWQIDIWRQLRNARDAAALRYLGTIDGRTYVMTRLVAEVAENYYGLMALDKRQENLDLAIQLQERSLQVATAQKAAARGTELAVQRFQAEVRKNQSQKLIVNQEIIEVENRINFLLGRFPQPVERMSANFFDLNLHALSVGLPSQLLLNRPDIRQAERQLEAAGLDIKVARARFFPALAINGGVGYAAFNPRYLLINPEALIGNIAGELIAPLVNKKAIQADYLSANARQLEAVYNYQRTVINAFTEVINRVAKVENYRKSIEIKKEQLKSLEASVTAANSLFQNARVDFMDVLYAQRDLIEARMVLIDTKREQLSAVVNAYQALGGGAYLWPLFNWRPPQVPQDHHLDHYYY
jgi:NodT family efflux transporter outer membrane factor (OMF) lipoprotein